VVILAEFQTTGRWQAEQGHACQFSNLQNIMIFFLAKVTQNLFKIYEE
jgi:hypothetical protein